MQNRNKVYLDKHNQLYFNPGNIGTLAIKANTEKFMEIQTREVYYGDYGPTPNYAILEPEKFFHGLRFWINPTAGSLAPHFLQTCSSKRGYLLPTTDFVSNVEHTIRYTDAPFRLTPEVLNEAVMQRRFPRYLKY